jgi:hypothetical protein
VLAVRDSATDFLAVRPWPDQVLDTHGLDPRSFYVERFWLPVLGPSVVLLLRLLAAGLEAQPGGFDLPVEDTARALGLGVRDGRNSPFIRTVNRCCQFRHAYVGDEHGNLLVRRRLPPLSRSQVLRLTTSLQDQHRAWEAERADPDADRLRARARHLALSLFELGEGAEDSERQLLRWNYPPLMASDAIRWAGARHREAVAEGDAHDAWRPNVTESAQIVTSNSLPVGRT